MVAASPPPERPSRRKAMIRGPQHAWQPWADDGVGLRGGRGVSTGLSGFAPRVELGNLNSNTLLSDDRDDIDPGFHAARVVWVEIFGRTDPKPTEK